MSGEADLTKRLMRAAGRAKDTPSRIEWLYANQESVNESLRQLTAMLAAISERLAQVEGPGGDGISRRLAQLDEDGRAGVTAIGGEIHLLRGRLDQQIARVDAAIAGQSGLLQRSVAAAGRDQELARLRSELGPTPDLRPGLSVSVACWNHAGFLRGAVASALETIDAIADEHLRGEVLLLDDASSDESAAVADELADGDDRVRVIRAKRNLGLSRARNALLHAASTSHAFQLDADNIAVPGGVVALFEVAQRTGSAFTYGNVIRRDEDGNTIGVMSNEPISAAWLADNYVDTMAVIDVGQLRPLGGFPEDPGFEPIDDWAVVHRIARAGLLIGFVPVVAGRYRVLRAGLNGSVGDRRIGPERVRRTFDSDRSLGADSIAAFAAHPLLGTLWSNEAAIRVNPELRPALPAADVASTTERRRLLLIGPGGVANLGDDAIVAAAIARIRRLAPDVDIDVITDGSDIGSLDPAAVWIGTVSEAVWGLQPADLPDMDGDAPVTAARARVPSASWPGQTVQLADYSAAVFVGGGTLTSLWGDTLISPRVVLGAALRHAGVPYLVSGQGIGPLEEADRRLVSNLLDGALATSVRDRASVDALHHRSEPAFTGDDALMLTAPSAGTVAEALVAAGVTMPYVALTVRHADYVGASQAELEQWAAAVDSFAHERGATVLGVALNDQQPTPEIVTLAGLAHGGSPRSVPWRLISCERDPHLLSGLLAGAEAVATHSYHAALFALRAGTPTVLAAANPYYRAKAAGLADLAGLDADAFVIGPASIAELPARLRAISDAQAAGAGLGAATRAVEGWWFDALGRLLRDPAAAAELQE